MDYKAMINGIEVHVQYSERTVRELFDPLLETLTELQRKKGNRILVMLAAPPGTGKSTLLSFLEYYSGHRIQTIGMDGFHRRQEYLLSHYVDLAGETIPMVRIKGAPITFDLDQLEAVIQRVADGEICGWPEYDRRLHNSVKDAVTIDRNIVLLEGNYLLLDEDGWRDLRKYADYTISIRADAAMLRNRLINRKIKTGVEREEAIRFVDFSDMPNVRLCLEKTMPADLQLYTDGKEYWILNDDARPAPLRND